MLSETLNIICGCGKTLERCMGRKLVDNSLIKMLTEKLEVQKK